MLALKRQVIDQPLLKEGCTHQIEAIIRQADHGRFQLNASALVQNMRQCNTTGLAR